MNAVSDSRASYERALTWPMLKEMVKSGLATVGAHTASHAVLACLSPAEVKAEFETSRARISEELRLPSPFLAYPFGQPVEIGPTARDAARAAGFAYAFTTLARPLTATDLSHPYDLPRVLLSAKGQSPAIVRAYLSGVPAALSYLRSK